MQVSSLICNFGISFDVSGNKGQRTAGGALQNFYRGTRVPCLFIAGKADQTGVLQNYYLDPQEFCAKYHLHDPIPFSSFDVRPRFVEGSSGPVDGARYRRSSADTVTPTDKRRTSWFLDDDESPEASPLRCVLLIIAYLNFLRW
ncbi:unnamed protein product [Rodentolepis nana]|uniref:Uncharacterized protein n=1 Tax=Rodentolepis nana TaxID=102285 RepID=A0A0R3U0X3_RODNA|nr:unnamed protein product [Rodentolepis nana]